MEYVENDSAENNNVKDATSEDFFEEVTKALKSETNVIVEGVAGSGKSHLLEQLNNEEIYGNGKHIEVVVFHPSTSYEDFVSGIRPAFNEEGEQRFVTHEGIFIKMCNRAAKDPENNYLLFIDEINRANTFRVFGDLMLVLEKSKREDCAKENRALFTDNEKISEKNYVRLQTSIRENGKEFTKLVVPSNLHVLGTMNTTDRSVGTIDLALRRRFHWITQEPMDANQLKETMERIGEKYPQDVATWFEKQTKYFWVKLVPTLVLDTPTSSVKAAIPKKLLAPCLPSLPKLPLILISLKIF